MHQFDFNLRMKLLGQSHVKARPLNDKKAIENGATFISESFIFGVAGSLILYESLRALKKEQARKEGVADDIATLQDEIEHIKRTLKTHNVAIEDYRPRADLNPTILKLDEHGNNNRELPMVTNGEKKSEGTVTEKSSKKTT